MQLLSPSQQILADSISDAVIAETAINPALSLSDLMGVLSYLVEKTGMAMADALEEETESEAWKNGGDPA